MYKSWLLRAMVLLVLFNGGLVANVPQQKIADLRKDKKSLVKEMNQLLQCFKIRGECSPQAKRTIKKAIKITVALAALVVGIWGINYYVSKRYFMSPDQLKKINQEQKLLKLHDTLIKTIKSDDLEAVKILQAEGAPLDGVPRDPNNDSQWQKDTPLLAAVEAQNYNIIRFLLTNGADPNKQYQGSIVPLAVAIKNKDEESVKLLLDHKADPNALIRLSSLLNEAIKEHQFNIVQLLIKHGAKIDSSGGKLLPLETAVETNQPNITSYLVDKGAQITEKALEVAIKAKNKFILSYLISMGGRVTDYIREITAQEAPELLTVLDIRN